MLSEMLKVTLVGASLIAVVFVGAYMFRELRYRQSYRRQQILEARRRHPSSRSRRCPS